MNVYLIRHDIDNFKFYLQDENDPLSRLAPNFSGESLLNRWEPYRIKLFEGKTKVEKSLSGDFNSSCFSSGLLYADGSISNLISKGVPGEIEELKVLPSDGRDFYYINVLRKIPALSYSYKQELQVMSRAQEYKFNGSIINVPIFRDEILSSNYFVTDRFVDLFHDEFHGVIFKKVGEI